MGTERRNRGRAATSDGLPEMMFVSHY